MDVLHIFLIFISMLCFFLSLIRKIQRKLIDILYIIGWEKHWNELWEPHTHTFVSHLPLASVMPSMHTVHYSYTAFMVELVSQLTFLLQCPVYLKG